MTYKLFNSTLYTEMRFLLYEPWVYIYFEIPYHGTHIYIKSFQYPLSLYIIIIKYQLNTIESH
jgi:hypothetical protein